MSTTKKASQSDLEKLHGLIVKDLIQKAQERPLSAQELSVAAKLLKDNEITCDPSDEEGSQGDPSAILKDDLPFDVEFGNV